MFVSDESALIKQFIDGADADDKETTGFQAKTTFLAASAVAFPDDLKDKKGKKIERPAECLDSTELVEAFFAERTTDLDWISEAAINAYRSRHNPTVSFF